MGIFRNKKNKNKNGNQTDNLSKKTHIHNKQMERLTFLRLQKKQQIKETRENLKMETIAANVAEVLSLVKVSNRKDEIIDSFQEELVQYRNGLKDVFLTPLLKAIVFEYDRVSKQYCFYLEKSRTEPQTELFGKLLSEFNTLSTALLILLKNYNIEPFDFNVGDALDFKSQKIIEVVETEDPQKDETVAEYITCGFRNVEMARIFRQAEVKIYKFKNNSNK